LLARPFVFVLALAVVFLFLSLCFLFLRDGENGYGQSFMLNVEILSHGGLISV
jgi:hypothetical protein